MVLTVGCSVPLLCQLMDVCPWTFCGQLTELLVMFGSACKHNEEQYPNISMESMEGIHGYGDV